MYFLASRSFPSCQKADLETNLLKYFECITSLSLVSHILSNVEAYKKVFKAVGGTRSKEIDKAYGSMS